MREYSLDIQIIKLTISAWLRIRLVRRLTATLHFAILNRFRIGLPKGKKWINFHWSQGHKPNF